MVVEIFESLGEDGGRKQRSEAANSVKKKKKKEAGHWPLHTLGVE